MDARTPEQSHATPAQPLLERLKTAGEAASAAQIVERLGLWQRPASSNERPFVTLNMISTVDGRATLGGRSGPISNSADKALFHGLRSATDAVLAGAGTVRTERYGRPIRDAERRQERLQRGLEQEPLTCIVSGRLALDTSIPLFAEPAARVVIVTNSTASLPASAAHVDYIRTPNSQPLDLGAALVELRERFAVRALLCEGGPHLACQMVAAGLVDELFLSVAAKLAGGDLGDGEASGGEALRMLAGHELQPPVELELLDVLRSRSDLFLRYGVLARECVSRETSSS